MPSLLVLLGWGEGQCVCMYAFAHRGAVGVCVFGVGMVATLTKTYIWMCVLYIVYDVHCVFVSVLMSISVF